MKKISFQNLLLRLGKERINRKRYSHHTIEEEEISRTLVQEPLSYKLYKHKKWKLKVHAGFVLPRCRGHYRFKQLRFSTRIWGCTW
jgi:hypothetical protein